MICQKCNHILKGSESFCPDCGSPCVKEKEAYKEPEAPSVIFSSDREVSSNIFSEEPPQKYRREQPKEKKSKAGIYLAVVLCAAIVGVIAVAGSELLGLTPVIASLLPDAPTQETTAPTTAVTEYKTDSGVVLPQVNYRTSVAYITGSKGQALRKGPDSSYGQIEILTTGTEVHIVGGTSIDSKWVYVYIPEKDSYGWLEDAFLSSVMESVSVQDEEESALQNKN